MDDPSSTSFLAFLKDSLTGKYETREESRARLEEVELIKNLEDYFKTTASEIMVPRTKMVTIESTDTIIDAVSIIRSSGYSKIPVQKEKRDNIVGVIHAADLLLGFEKGVNTPVSMLMTPPYFASYCQPIHQILNEFQKRDTRLAIVVDEYGGVDGLITLDAILHELLGEITLGPSEEADPDYEEVEDQLIIMDANYPLEDFNELYKTEFTKEGIETIGGYICHRLGKIPKKDEGFQLDRIPIAVEESTDRQLVKLKLISPNALGSI